MKLSIVIPSKDRVERLLHTLCCLVPQKNDFVKEVIVVNDGQVNSLCNLPKHLFESLPLDVIPGKQLGRASARNIGAAHAGGDILLFMDDDMLTPMGFVDSHIIAHHGRPGRFVHGAIRELIAAALLDTLDSGRAGFPALNKNKLQQAGFEPEGYRTSINTLEKAVETLFNSGRKQLAPWLAGAGANISLARDLWKELGGFNDRFGTTWGCEDLEFCYRAHRSGSGIVYRLSAMAFHLSHAHKTRWQDHKNNLALFYSLHQDPAIKHLHLLLSEKQDIDAYVSALTMENQSRNTETA